MAVKTFLAEKDIPRQWYNLAADLPTPRQDRKMPPISLPEILSAAAPEANSGADTCGGQQVMGSGR